MSEAGEQSEIDAPAEPPVEVPRLHGAPVAGEASERVVFVDRGGLVELVSRLRADGYHQCVDLCAVDYLTHPGRTELPAEIAPERFEVVASFINHHDASRVRVRVQVPESDPSLPTLFMVHPGVEAMEREAYDLMGITFEGHPDMSRILMPDDWVGHPLRKDYDVGRIPVQFKAAPGAR